MHNQELHYTMYSSYYSPPQILQMCPRVATWCTIIGGLLYALPRQLRGLQHQADRMKVVV